MMPDLLECWQMANGKLCHLADCIRGSASQPAHIALGYLTAVAEELRGTEALLRETQSLAPARKGMDESLVQYRNCLKRLQEAVSGLQVHMLAQRSRLEPERAHVQAAAAWAACTKQTVK